MGSEAKIDDRERPLDEAVDAQIEAVRRGIRGVSRAISRERDAANLLRCCAEALVDPQGYTIACLVQGEPRIQAISALSGDDTRRWQELLHGEELPTGVRNVLESGQGTCSECLPDGTAEIYLPLQAEGVCYGILVAVGPANAVTGVMEKQLLREAAEDMAYALRGIEREAAARRNEELLLEMGRMGAIGGFDFDPKTGEGTWTEGVALIHDLDPSIPTRVSLGLSYYAPESRPIIEEAVERISKHGVPYDLELELISAKGVRKWIRTIAKAVFEGTRVVKVCGTMQDISDRKRAEQALREQVLRQEQLVRIARSVSGAIFTLRSWESGELSMPYASEKAVDVLGFLPEQLADDLAPCVSCLSQDARSTWESSLRYSAHKLSPWRVAFRYRHPLKGDRWLEWSAIPQSLPNGSTQWDGIVLDSTDRHAAEEALLESEETYRSLVENMHSGVVHCRMLYSEDGRPIDFIHLHSNAAFEKTTGLGNPVGRRASEMTPVIKEGDPELLELYGRVAKGGEPVHLERYIEPLGNWFAISVYQTKLDHFVVVLDQVTQRREAESALFESEARFRTIFEQAAMGIAQVDPMTGRFLKVNQKLCHLLGYTNQEMLALSFPQVAHPPQPCVDEGQIQRMKAHSDTGFIREKQYTRKDGSLVWAKVTASKTMPGPDGSLYFTAVIEDVTERHRAEEALRESERLWRTIFEVNLLGIFIIRLQDRKIVEVNPALQKQLGFSREEIIGKTTLELNIYTDIEERERFYHDFQTKGMREPIECTFRLKSGDTGNFLVASGVADIGGQPCIIGVCHDITALRQTDAALRESEAQLRAMFDLAPLGIAQADPATGAFLAVNDRMCQITGYTSQELLQMKIRDLAHPEDREREADIVGRIASGELPETSYQKRYICKDSSVAWINVNATLIRDRKGKPSRTFAMLEDITEAKAAVLELEASQERYRSLVDNLEDVVLTADASGTIRFVNKAVRNFGYRAEDLIGTNVGRLVHREEIAALLKMRDEGFPRVENREWRVLDACGKVRLVRVGLRLQPEGVTVVAVDVTQQRATEEQLRAAQKMEAVGRLAGGVAHDFNNLLTVILSYSEMGVKELPEGAPLKADLEEVVEAARRAESLTRQLLAFSRRQVLLPELLDVNSLVSGVENMLRRLIGEDIELDVYPGEGPCQIRADRGQLEQVLLNLVVNSRDAMPGGGRVTVTTGAVDLGEEVAAPLEIPAGSYVELSLADTGCGMDAETQARIFEPFFTTKGIGKGTGLGLSMVYGIVRQSEGGIAVNSKPGKGATFSIYLPRSLDSTLGGAGGRNVTRIASGHETILVVEDEVTLGKLIRRVLTGAGYHVLSASNAGEAFLLCEKQGAEVHLVLTDVIMPGMSGTELAQRIAPLCPSARIMYMSGYTDEALEQHGLVDQEFLQKPFDAQTLTDRIRTLLDKR